MHIPICHSHQPRLEAPRLSYPPLSDVAFVAPWAPLRASSMLRRPCGSISERSKTKGSSLTESSSPRTCLVIDPVKLPRDDCGGVCLCEAIPIYRLLPKGELDAAVGISPSGGFSSDRPRCIIPGVSEVSISAAGLSSSDPL